MRIVDAIYADQRAPVRRPWQIALVCAVSLHAAVLVSAALAEPTLEVWAAGLALELHNVLSREEVVTLETPPPPKLPERAPVKQTTRPSRTATPAPARPAAPAQAAAVLTADETPADLTGNTFVSGNATHFSGGATAASGTATTPVAVAASGPDKSEPVHLSATDWSCPWPREADSEQIDSQRIVLKVEVAPDGTVLNAKVVRDAPAGFGAAALACAKRTRFEPAEDHAGTPIRAWSPPIEVTFTR